MTVGPSVLEYVVDGLSDIVTFIWCILVAFGLIFVRIACRAKLLQNFKYVKKFQFQRGSVNCLVGESLFDETWPAEQVVVWSLWGGGGWNGGDCESTMVCKAKARRAVFYSLSVSRGVKARFEQCVIRRLGMGHEISLPEIGRKR